MALESFIGLDTGEGMSESAFEALKQKMQAASAQIAAIRKEEKKQKKKEDELIKILLKFVKNSQKRELVLLVSRAIEENIPANFILAIILLGNEDVQQEVGNYLLPMSAQESTSLVFFSNKDETLPLKIKIELDAWIKGLLFQAEETPQKLLRTAYKIEILEIENEDSEFGGKKIEEKKTIKQILINLIAFVIKDYFEQNSVEEDYEKTDEFAEFILKGILNKTEEHLKNRPLLSDKSL